MLNPKTDIIFKKIFGSKENKSILISFINSVVSQEDQVADLVLDNPYTIQNYLDSKMAILDISATALDGRKFNIEMQVNKEEDYEKRALYYWAKLYNDQLDSSGFKEYYKLRKTIGIHILNFVSLTQTENYHSIFHMVEKNTGIRAFNDIELHFIELKKFTSQKKMIQFMNNLDMWTGFLSQNNMLNSDQLPKYLDKLNLDKAFKTLDTMNLNKEERKIYEAELKSESDIASQLRTAKREGESQGKIKGKIEGKIEIAKNLLKMNLSIEQIIQATGLTKKEIEKIKL